VATAAVPEEYGSNAAQCMHSLIPVTGTIKVMYPVVKSQAEFEVGKSKAWLLNCTSN
jgi:hypothetical protein